MDSNPNLLVNNKEAVLQCMEEGVIITDCDLSVSFYNTAATRILRFSKEAVFGKALSEYLDNKPLLGLVKSVLDDGLSYSLDFSPGQISDAYLRVRCAPVIIAKSQGLAGTVTVFEDITTLKQKDRLKSEFVAMVSHELKAPLATIQQMIYFLADGKVGSINDSQSQILHRTQVRLGELLDLVGNLLDLSRIESETLLVRMEPLNIGPLVEDCLGEFKTASETKNIKLSFVKDKPVPKVMGDRRSMEIVIKNLVGNAVKYTIGGGKVTVGLHHLENSVVLTVRDTGIGIPTEELTKIFDKFYRVKDEKARWVTGTGLGLSITKTLVENHKGRIAVESTRGEGTLFTVTLLALIE